MWDRGRTAALLLLLGCSREGQDAVLHFAGTPPAGALFEDTRAVAQACPVCGVDLAGNVACPHPVRRASRAPCGFCRGSKACSLCAAFETGGACRHCRGGGPAERGGACAGCAGSGLCAACGGTSLCHACAGTGELNLPWRGPPVKLLATRPPEAPSRPPVRRSRAVLWEGQEIEWSHDPPAPAATWTVHRLEGGAKVEVQRLRGDPVRFRPSQAGLYMADDGAAGRVYFDAVGFSAHAVYLANRGLRVLRPHGEFEPPVRPEAVRWEAAGPGGPPERRGTEFILDRLGRYEFHPVLDAAGRSPRGASYEVLELRVQPPAARALPAGVPVPFRLDVLPSLPKDETVEWSVEGPPSARVTEAGVVFPGAGRYRVQARLRGAWSAPLEVAAFAVALRGAADRPLSEAPLSFLSAGAFDDRRRLRPEAVLEGPNRVRIVLDDPSTDPGDSVTVRTKAADGSELNRPVTYALDASRATRPILCLADRADEAAEADGRPDDAPEDPTLLAAPQGRVEVFYRGTLAASFPVAPSFLHDVPVRFIILRRPGLPEKAELDRRIDRRLAEANAVWAPLGRRFTRASAEIVEPPGNLLLVRGRAAGLDSRGHAGRVGARVDGAEWSVPTAWKRGEGPATPAETARALARALPPGLTAEVLDRLLAGDPEAVLLRVRRRDGSPAKVEAFGEPQDAAQSALPLVLGARAGCEIDPEGRTRTLDEAAVLAGCRGQGGEGLDLVLVGEIRSGAGRRAFRAYASGAAIVGPWALESPGRYPYALGRILGELLLPPGVRPSEEDTLFAEPLSEAAGVEARKRVGAETARQILERGRVLAGQK